MLINEIVKPQTNALTEGMMKYPEWRKDKYANPFIDMILNGEEEPINYIKDGLEAQGILKATSENQEMAEYLQNVLNQGGDTKDLAMVSFTVEVLDDDDNPTGTLEEVKLQEIIKDERVTGQLRVNLGNIAELVLGCAVTAKYEKQKSDITSEDVIDVAIRLAKGNGQVVSDAGKDNITFQASVPSADKKAFAAFVGEDPKGRTLADFGVKPEVVRGINNHIKSAVTYVNTSPRVLLAVDKAAADPGQNNIEVMSDGGNAEQQKTTKVDLKITIDGTRLNLLSIKAGNVGQFGQVSGYEFDKLNGFFEQSLGMSLSPKVEKSFQKFDLSLKGKERNANRTAVREANYSTAFNAAYDEVEKKLRALSKGDQLDLLERVYNGLLYHATRNEEGVEMVILSPNAKTAFSELTFGPELREALDDYQLVIHRGQSAKMHLLQVYGYPKTQKAKSAMGSSKEMLVQYRSYAQANAVRNIIEMGNLLKELADWEKIEARRGEKQAGQATPTAPAKLAQKPQPVQPVAQAPVSPQPQAEPEVEPMGGPNAKITDLADGEFTQRPDELTMLRKNAGLNI
jgi:hypothetical protein